MKLISKTILYYLLISLPLLVIAGLLSYHLIRSEVRDGTDEMLWKEKLHSENLLKLKPEIKNIYLSLDSLSVLLLLNFIKTNTLFQIPLYLIYRSKNK